MVFFEIWIIQLLQAILPYFVWDLLNLLGTEIIYVGLLGVAYWCFNKEEAKVAIHLFMFSNFLNILFKYAFRMPRPDPSLRLDPEYAADTSYGFPSGATQNATTFWGWASLKLQRWWLWIIAAFFIVITAFARMGLGLHFLGDVIGGIIIGIVIVTMSYWMVPYFRRQWRRMKPILQQWVLPISTLLFFGIFYVAYALLLIPYFPTENIAVSMGVLFGFGSGAALEARYIRFSTEIPQNIRTRRAIFGLIIALVVYYIFDFGFDLLNAFFLFHYGLRFIKYALVGFFGAFVIPFVFKCIEPK